MWQGGSGRVGSALLSSVHSKWPQIEMNVSVKPNAQNTAAGLAQRDPPLTGNLQGAIRGKNQ